MKSPRFDLVCFNLDASYKGPISRDSFPILGWIRTSEDKLGEKEIWWLNSNGEMEFDFFKNKHSKVKVINLD